MTKKYMVDPFIEVPEQGDDSDIDYSDIPKTTEAQWAKAKVRPARIKSPISIRLDPDVLAWFRSKGKGYQSRINAVLRAHYEAERDKDTEG